VCGRAPPAPGLPDGGEELGDRTLHTVLVDRHRAPGLTRLLGLAGKVDAQIGEVAVALGHVEAVTDDEVRLDLETYVLEADTGPLLAELEEEGADGERLRPAGEQALAQ